MGCEPQSGGSMGCEPQSGSDPCRMGCEPRSGCDPCRMGCEPQSGGAEIVDLNILMGDFEGATSMMLGNLDEARPGYKLIEGVFDTGAVNSVTPPGIFSAKVRPSPMSRAGKKYRGPDKSPIPNLGPLDAKFVTDEGIGAGLTFQVADIERPLIAGGHITAAGNRVTLEEKMRA